MATSGVLQGNQDSKTNSSYYANPRVQNDDGVGYAHGLSTITTYALIAPILGLGYVYVAVTQLELRIRMGAKACRSPQNVVGIFWGGNIGFTSVSPQKCGRSLCSKSLSISQRFKKCDVFVCYALIPNNQKSSLAISPPLAPLALPQVEMNEMVLSHLH